MDPTPAEALLLAKKKKKGVTMPLGDFQTASWADGDDGGAGAPPPLMNDPLADLPKAPVRDSRFDAPRDHRLDYPSRDYPSRDYSSPDSMPRGPRSEVSAEAIERASGPPFKMFIGNLSFSVTEGQLNDFFADLNVKNVRLIMDRETGRPKGFAYAEFDTRDALKSALSRAGMDFFGRSLNLDLATERPDAPRRSGFGGMESRSETATSWRREAPLEPAAPRGGFRRDDREGGFRRDDREGGFRRDDREGGFRRDDRSFDRPSYSSSSSSSSGERPRLALKPRSVDSSAAAAAAAAASSSSSSSKPRSNPFGDAKPRDELEAQRRIEERRKAAEAAAAATKEAKEAKEPKEPKEAKEPKKEESGEAKSTEEAK